MEKAKLKSKLIAQGNRIVGYEIELNGENKFVSKEKALQYVKYIEGAYVRNNLIALKNMRMENIRIRRIDNFKFMDKYKIADNIQTGGVSSKIVVYKSSNNSIQKYMLKFGREKLGVIIKDYISEYISCNIARKLGYNVQEVDLGYFRNKECAVIKWIDEEIITFDGLGNSTVDGYPLSREDVTYNLDWLLSIKMKENKFELTQKEYNTWVWKVFLLDMLVGNFDRHEGNWGFIRNKRGLYEPSPLYDMGSSMYQRYIGLNTDKWTDAYVKNEIEYKTRSAIIYKDKKRNYFELMKTFINNDRVRELLVELLNKIDNTSFKDIYKNIGDYNSDYKEYARFVERVINMRIKLLKELIK